jgi:AcrR family transcriptional regulator
LRLVDERGLDRVTVEEISEAADVSPRTFFNYFATKDEALLGDQFADTDEVCARFLAVEPGVPVMGALFEALRPGLEAMQSEPESWFLRMRVMAQNPSLVSRLLTRGVAAEQALAEAIMTRAGVTSRNAYPLVCASVTGAAVRAALSRWAESGGGRDLTELVQEAFDVLATGLVDPVIKEDA